MTLDDRLGNAASNLGPSDISPPDFNAIRKRASRRRSIFGAVGAAVVVVTGFGAVAANRDSPSIRVTVGDTGSDTGSGTSTTLRTSASGSTAPTTTSLLGGPSMPATPTTPTGPSTTHPTTEPSTTVPPTSVSIPDTTIVTVSTTPETITTQTILPVATDPPTSSAPTTAPFTPCLLSEPACRIAAFEPDPQPDQPIVISGTVTPRVQYSTVGAPTTFAPSVFIDLNVSISDPDGPLTHQFYCAEAPITIQSAAGVITNVFDYAGTDISGPRPACAQVCGPVDHLVQTPAAAADRIDVKFSAQVSPGTYTVTIMATGGDCSNPYSSPTIEKPFSVTVTY